MTFSISKSFYKVLIWEDYNGYCCLTIEGMMPVYEYNCLSCLKKFELSLTYSEFDKLKASCPTCGSENVRRLIRSVRIARDDHARLAEMADPAKMSELEDNPRLLGRMMKDMRDQVGADDLPGEFDEVVNRLEMGQTTDEIEKDMPDLASTSSESA
jgi:putative FmdB family regulatory protein